MTDCLPRFSPQGVKLGKRGRETRLISQEHASGCYDLCNLTHIPSAPSPRLNPKCNLTRSCFTSLADLNALDSGYDGQILGAMMLNDQKLGFSGNNAWGWFVNEEY